MSSSEKQQAYDSYQNAKTEGTKQGFASAEVLHGDFVSYINNFQEVDPDTIDVSHLGDVSFPKEMFYRTLMSTAFHVHWARYDPPAFGPGNTLLPNLRRNDAGNYVLSHVASTERTRTYTFEEPVFVINSNSISMEEGLVKCLFKLTDKYVNGVRVWNHQLVVGDRVYANYYVVPFELV